MRLGGQLRGKGPKVEGVKRLKRLLLGGKKRPLLVDNLLLGDKAREQLLQGAELLSRASRHFANLATRE